MSNEFVLRPEELFCLGKLMNAEYIDYDYIAALREIGRNYPQVESKCMLNLAREKLVRQRISGDISVIPPLERLLKNVFFGKLETVLDIAVCGKTPQRTTYRIHYHSGSATMVVADEEKLRLSAITEPELKELIRSAVGRHTAAPRRNAKPDADSITRLISAKCAKVDVGSRKRLLLEQNGALYLEIGDEWMRPITDTEAADMLFAMLKGE